MRISIVTLFPDLFAPWLGGTVLARAIDRGILEVFIVSIRAHGEGRHRQVDDRPFGGGPGMVLMAEPLVRAVEAAQTRHASGARTLLLTPQGQRFDQGLARDLARHEPGFVLVCGRYEGIDERAIEHLQAEEVSLGDFVLSGGEPAALAILEATARLVPGVLGHERSAVEDSFNEETGLLDHPQFTRPATWRGRAVPQVLLDGNHAKIVAWRAAQARHRTAQRRPDLLDPRSGESPSSCSPA